MGPDAAAQLIVDISVQVYLHIDQAKANKEQCKRLGERVKIISETIVSLVGQIPPVLKLETPGAQATKPGGKAGFAQGVASQAFGMIEGGLGLGPMPVAPTVPWMPPPAVSGKPNAASSSASSSQPGAFMPGSGVGMGAQAASALSMFMSALLDLKQTVEEALSLVQRFSHKNWVHRVMRSGTHQEVFDDLHRRMSEGVQQLSLGLNIQINQLLSAPAPTAVAPAPATAGVRPGTTLPATRPLGTTPGTGVALSSTSPAVQMPPNSALEALRLQWVRDLETLASQLTTQSADAKAVQLDMQTLMANQQVIIEQNMELKYALQKLDEEEARRFGLWEQQMASFKLSFEQAMQKQSLALIAKPTEATPKAPKPPHLPTRLLIPFHRIDVDRIIHNQGLFKVYVGRYLQQEVAVKVLEGDIPARERELFIREIALMKRMRSEQIMTLFAVSDEPGRMALVMRYMPKGDLGHYLKDHVITASQKHQIILDMALGLKYLHSEGIIHSDLKPANVLLDEYLHARITDFGTSRHEVLSMSLGQRSYDVQWTAPEVLTERTKPTKSADIYSFGVMVWQLCTAATPFGGQSASAIVRAAQQGSPLALEIPTTIAPVYQELIRRSLHVDPASRPGLDDIITRLRQSVPEDKSMASPSSSTSTSQATISANDYYFAGLSYEQAGQEAEARRCYEAAAPSVYRAKTNLGSFYLQGKGGLSKDSKQAFTLFKSAAEQGHTRAMQNLSYCYEHGEGTLPDATQASLWRERAKGPH